MRLGWRILNLKIVKIIIIDNFQVIDFWISLISNFGILYFIFNGGIKILIFFVSIEKGDVVFVMGFFRYLRSRMFIEWFFQYVFE